MTSDRPETCPSCAADPKVAHGRYCAPLRCYCSHPECPAFASYRPPTQPFPYVELLHPRRTERKP